MGRESGGQAYSFELYARKANEVLLDQVDDNAGTLLLDIACGSGYAAAVAV
jgi:hypothetical protein